MTLASIISSVRQAWDKRPSALRWLNLKAASTVAAFGFTGIFLTFIISQGNVGASPGHDGGHDETSEVSGQASQYPIVTVEQPRPAGSVQISIEAAGQVFAQQQADVYPLQDGVIQSLSVNLGSRVSAGQVLAVLRADQSQQQLAAEIAYKQTELEIARQRAVIKTDSHVKAANQEKAADTQKIDAQAVGFEKEKDAQIQKIDAQIAGVKAVKEQRLQAMGSAGYDLLDSLNEILFTQSDAIANYDRNAAYNYYRRMEVMPDPAEREKFERQIVEFAKKLKAGNVEPMALASEAMAIGQKARQVSLSISQSNAFPTSRVDAVRKEIGDVTDHLLELTTELTESDSGVKGLEAEKRQILASTEQQIAQIAPDRSKLDATTQQKLVEIQGERKNADLDAELIAADIVRLRQQVGAGRTVVAPFSGVITKRLVNAGESVTLEKPVFSLVDDRTKYIRFHISEADLPFVKAGTTVTFSPTSAPSEKFTAIIKRIAQSVDPETRTIQVEADIPTQPNADRILAQMTIRVQIPVTQDPSLLVVLESALQLGKISNTLWVVSADVTAEAKQVEVAFIHSGYAYVRSGLSATDWVIVKSPVTLSAGLEIDTKRSASPIAK